MKKIILTAITSLLLSVASTTNAEEACYVADYANPIQCQQIMDNCIMNAFEAGVGQRISPTDAVTYSIYYRSFARSAIATHSCSVATGPGICTEQYQNGCHWVRDKTSFTWLLAKEKLNKVISALNNSAHPPYEQNLISCSFKCKNIQGGICQEIPPTAEWQCK